jgi:hypothetical protein
MIIQHDSSQLQNATQWHGTMLKGTWHERFAEAKRMHAQMDEHRAAILPTLGARDWPHTGKELAKHVCLHESIHAVTALEFELRVHLVAVSKDAGQCLVESPSEAWLRGVPFRIAHLSFAYAFCAPAMIDGVRGLSDRDESGALAALCMIDERHNYERVLNHAERTARRQIAAIEKLSEILLEKSEIYETEIFEIWQAARVRD